jgi:hypothetical protein
VVCSIIGIAFGWYPAWKAAKLAAPASPAIAEEIANPLTIGHALQ